MNKVKRILAIVMAMAMVMAMSVTTFAAGESGAPEIGTEADRGTITVSGIDTEDKDVSAVAYKIIEAKYEATGEKFSGYNSLYAPNVTINADGSVAITEEALSTIMKRVADTPGIPMKRSNDKASFNAEVEVGSYLVVIQNAETKIYSPVVVSVAYKNVEGNYNIESGNADVLAEVVDGEGWVKVRENPVLTKVIVEAGADKKGNTANIGDIVNYKLTTTIPYYGGAHPKFEITDKLTGLTYAENLVIKVQDKTEPLVKGQDYTVTVNDAKNEVTINFVVGNTGYTLNEYQGKQLTITYDAEVNRDAKINQDANNNVATLSYSKDSTKTGEPGKSESKTKTYTFDIDAAVNGSVTKKILTKVGEEVDGSRGPLEDAEFTLYKNYENGVCSNVYTQVEGTKTVFTGVVHSNGEGQLLMKGLNEGTYYLKETKAPTGYSLLNTVYTIVIDADVNADGELTGWTITVNGDTIPSDSHTATSSFTVDHGTVTDSTIGEVDIPNTKISTLPSTGGIGITIFTIVGCLIMIAAASMFFMSRRKTEE